MLDLVELVIGEARETTCDRDHETPPVGQATVSGTGRGFDELGLDPLDSPGR